MDQPYAVAVVTVLVVFGILLLMLLLFSGGDMGRIGVAGRGFWRSLRDREFADKIAGILVPAMAKPAAPVKLSGVPLRFLALLQREGRLVDFLLEDVQAYPDAQIGAAVRDIHRQCQAALNEHLVMQPVLPQAEGSPVEVPAGFDPSAIRLTGNVTGQPPFRGTLQHHGWRVTEIKLAPPPDGQDDLVLMPAEVEIQ
jgi:Domain of unknown function (DUF2760)